MRCVLKKRPNGATIIQGFPSVGLVSTIATKFLIEHLDIEEIGYIDSEKITPLAAIHKGKLIRPITIYYNKKYNLVIIQSLSEIRGIEWKLAEIILDLAKRINAKEIITLEGTPTQTEEIKIYYFSTKSKLKDVKPIEEGLIMGVTATLFLKTKTTPITCIFAETHTNFPDSKAAAKVVEALDSYLKIKIDIKPLLKIAEKFEENLKKYMAQSKQLTPGQGEDKESYFG